MFQAILLRDAEEAQREDANSPKSPDWGIGCGRQCRWQWQRFRELQPAFREGCQPLERKQCQVVPFAGCMSKNSSQNSKGHSPWRREKLQPPVEARQPCLHHSQQSLTDTGAQRGRLHDGAHQLKPIRTQKTAQEKSDVIKPAEITFTT